MGQAKLRKELGLIRPFDPPWTPFEPAQFKEPDAARPGTKVWLNSRYQVLEIDCDSWVWLSIKRIDRLPIHDWRDLQRIKNELVGAECEGLEQYPAQSRVVDTANQYHLFVNKDPTFRLPFGWKEGEIDHTPGIRADKSRQRPIEGEQA